MLRYSVLQQSLYLACNTLEMNAHTILSNTGGKTCGKVPFFEGVNRGI